MKYILFPSSYFSLHKVDENLQKEYEAVCETGLFGVIFFGYQKWFDENELVLSEQPGEEVAAVYRGWMMQPERYRDFYEALLGKNIRLLTAPDEYENLHIFPKVYPYIIEDTAGTLIYPEGTSVDLAEVKRNFSRFMIKDFVKSVKGTEFPRFFSTDVTEEEFEKWMEVFYKYRGGLYTGGVCVKEFLELKKYDGATNEYRTYFVRHQVMTVCRNSLQPAYTAEPPTQLLEKYAGLGSPFYTIDCAELADGSWKILETGDGQVSGLSEGQNYAAFFRALDVCLG